MNEQFQLIYSSSFEILKTEYENNLFQMNELKSYEDEFGVFVGKIIGTTEEGKILIEKSNAIQSYGLKEVTFLMK